MSSEPGAGHVWLSSAKITAPLAFLLATLAERIAVPDTIRAQSPKDVPQRLEDALVKLFHKYYTQINENSGVKETNILALFGPLGIPATALGTTLLPNLNTLGAMRGSHAHQSAKAVQSVLDPETEYNRIDALLTDLVVLDEWLAAYKRRIR